MADGPKAWMPLFIGDYLADTAHLTTTQHGAYLLLIMHYWRSGEALPDDDRQLCQITRMQTREWSRNRAVILSFFEHTNGTYVHQRCEHELASAIERKQRNKSRASAAAGARWSKESDAPSMLQACSKHAPSTTQAMLEECPSPSPSPLEISPKGAISKNIDQSGFTEFWKAYPRKVGKGQAEKAYAKALKLTSPETILTAARRYASERAGQDPQYTRHPATWLNGQGWEDEPTTQERSIHDRPTYEQRRRDEQQRKSDDDSLKILQALGLAPEPVDDVGAYADWDHAPDVD